MYLFDIRKDRVIPLNKIKCTYSELRWYRGIIRPYQEIDKVFLFDNCIKKKDYEYQ